MIVVGDVQGDEAYARRLGDIAAAAADVRPAMRQLADEFDRLEAERFAAAGPGWEPLNPRYAREKQAAGRGSAILELAGGAGGRLRRALTDSRATYAVRDVDRGGAAFGTNLGIAGVHHRGGTLNIPAGTTKAGRRRPARTVRIPARPLIDIDGRTAERWGELLGAHLTGDSSRRGSGVVA